MLAFASKQPIRFGTDGWRGIIAADFTFARVQRVAVATALVLRAVFQGQAKSNTIIVGYDRRFLADEFALTAAEAIQAAGFRVRLANCYAPTPAFSYAAHHQKALGAIVLTASHNPAGYLGLKVKGAFGGSVSGEITAQIEAGLAEKAFASPGPPGQLDYFDPWQDYCDGLQKLVDLDLIRQMMVSGKIQVFADVLHGSAAGGLTQILQAPVQEIHCEPDPLFGGRAPEPLEKNLSRLQRQVRASHQANPSAFQIGLVFDGDGDRIAALSGDGQYLSSQKLIPILLAHLSQNRSYGGEVVKTVSGSDLIPKLAKCYGLPVFETPIGYKYIAERMQTTQVLLGGEESGGIGYGHHIPERDALLAALYLLEAIATFKGDIADIYQSLQAQANCFTVYDRIDLRLKDFTSRDRLLSSLADTPPTAIAERSVSRCDRKDGYKFYLADGSWLLIRFSGTEPVLRLYSEAATLDAVTEILSWAQTWANQHS